jgi:HK97 family phage portal protein
MLGTKIISAAWTRMKAAVGGGSYGGGSLDSIFLKYIGKTNSGATVNKNTATSIPAVWSAISIIADMMAMFPCDVLQKTDKGRKEISDHRISGLFNNPPNEYMTAFTARQIAQHHALLFGNAYFEIERNNSGEAVALWPLLPEQTDVRKDRQTQSLFIRTSIDGQTFDIPAADVLHIKGLGYDGYVGYSVLLMLRQTFGLALAQDEFAAKFFGNDAKSGGFLQHPGKLSEVATKNIEDDMNKKGGLDKAHRVKVLEEGMKFVQTTIAPEEAQFLQSRDFSVADIARVFRIPLFLLQSNEKSTSWGTGLAQQMQAFVTVTLQPWATQWEQEIKRKLLTEDEIEKGIYIKFNMRALLRGDDAGRAKLYQRGILDGWLTRNEVRELEDMNPIDGLDEPLVPLNMTSGDEPENDNPI